MDKSRLSIKNFNADIKSLQELLNEGLSLQDIEQLHGRDASRDVAYLMTTSGTSGLQVRWNLLGHVIVVVTDRHHRNWPKSLMPI
jgi:hypothetical protein